MSRITDALRLRKNEIPDVPDSATQEFCNDCADMGADRVNRYRLYEDMYDGEHRTRVEARAAEYLQANLGVCFTENFVDTVVDALADRLRITGFEVQDNAGAAEWLTTTVWPASRGDVLQTTVHTRTPMLGDGCLIVDWDTDLALPRAHWNRPHNVKPYYADDGNQELLYASKTWASTYDGQAVRRLNVYFDDRIEKYYTLTTGDDATWLRYLDSGDVDEMTGEQVWPTPWVDENDEPLGVPVFFFRHKALGDIYGRSRVRGCIPFQLELNKLLLDIFEVADQQGWPQRWATNVDQNSKIKSSPGTVIRLSASTSGQEVKVGQFSAADLSPLFDAAERLLKRWATKTRTPLHELDSSEPPSGESRKTAEAGMVKEAQQCQSSYGAEWAHVALLMLRMGRAYGDLGFDFTDTQQVTVNWDDAESRNDLDEANVALIDHELGASQTTLLRRRGYDPEEEQKLRTKEAPPTVPVPPPGG